MGLSQRYISAILWGIGSDIHIVMFCMTVSTKSLHSLDTLDILLWCTLSICYIFPLYLLSSWSSETCYYIFHTLFQVGPQAIYVVGREDDGDSFDGGSEVSDDGASWETVDDNEMDAHDNTEKVNPHIISFIARPFF